MQSSTSATFRAIVMLACAVGIPALAVSGTSWSEILKKFQDFHWPAILNLASASSPTDSHDAPPCSVGDAASPSRTSENGNDQATSADLQTPATTTDRDVSASNPLGFGEIQDRLRKLGATYYLLESWGNQQQFYRFSCKVAVGGNADYTHYFEAVGANPHQAMIQVLQQIEAWRGK
jgi:hypothetical protein